MRRPTSADRRSERTAHQGAGAADPAEIDEHRRQRWIAETTAAFLTSGATDPDPAGAERRRAFRRAALNDEQVPSRRDQWTAELTSAFGPTAI